MFESISYVHIAAGLIAARIAFSLYEKRAASMQSTGHIPAQSLFNGEALPKQASLILGTGLPIQDSYPMSLFHGGNLGNTQFHGQLHL